MDLVQKRHELNAKLEAVLGTTEVHFQPDEESRLKYPCIVYERDPAFVVEADNIKYLITQRYKVTLIDRSPDSPVFGALLDLPFCSHTTSFRADGLNHDVFDLYH